MNERRQNFLTGFLRGLRGFLRVPAILTRYKLWHYQLLPAFLSLALSLGVLAGVFFSARGLAGWLDGLIEIPVPWIDEMVTLSIGIFSFLAMVVAFVFLHKHLVLICLAPFLGRLAMRTVRGIEGEKFREVLPFWEAIGRSIKINLRYIVRELGFTLLFLFIGLIIPAVGTVFSTVMIFMNESRFAGFGLIDFPLEYKGFKVPESVDYAKNHTGLATGLGAGYLLILLIPIVGWMFAPTFATIAGTIEALDDLRRNEDDLALSKP